jgi:hypothetical protein
MELLITLVVVYYGLKLLAHLMKQDSVRSAGEELDRTLNETASTARGCAIKGCGYYLLLCVVCMISGLILGVISGLLGR